MKRFHNPSDFKKGTVFVGKINNAEFKVLELYNKGDSIPVGLYGGRIVIGEPTAKIVETKTGKVQRCSLEYLCHLLVDIKNENSQTNPCAAPLNKESGKEYTSNV